MMTRMSYLSALILITGAEISARPVCAQSAPPAAIEVTNAAAHWYVWNAGSPQYQVGSIEQTAGWENVALCASSNICLANYGSICAERIEGWESFAAEYQPIVTLEMRWTRGIYRGAEVTLRSFQRGSPYSGISPGAHWLSRNLESTIDWVNMIWQSAGSYSPPAPPFAWDSAAGPAASGSSDGISARLPGTVDRLFIWWARHGIAGSPFGFMPAEIGLDLDTYSSEAARISVRTFPAPPYQPQSWSVSRSRADIRIELDALPRAAEADCADLDGTGSRDVADIFALLTFWFSADGRADWTADGELAADDLFAYLRIWFSIP